MKKGILFLLFSDLQTIFNKKLNIKKQPTKLFKDKKQDKQINKKS